MAHRVANTPEQGSDAIPMEKNAGLIMGTNNSSIVSKRSVEKLYLPQPHFYRYFVKKPQRRAPGINRGYWLRMRAIDWVIRQFLEKASDRKKVVINLGCGYDPIPFQWMAQHKDLCNNTQFIDVDFQELMLSKREIILNTPIMRDMLSRTTDVESDDGVVLAAEEYIAVGCDLRNLKRLERLLKSVVDIDDCLVLCVAEVSITYMATEDADALLQWTSTLSSDVTFCLLEQQSPDRPDHPFTATMMRHFAKLGTPLRSVQKYPGCHSQILRFQDAGFTHIEQQNLWELWADPRFLSPSQRISLDEVEPFDEWEEFALFASHYVLIVAQTGPDPLISEQPRSRRASIDSLTSDLSARTVSPHRADTQWFAYKYSANAEKEGRTHHASSYLIPSHDAIGIHGGVGPQSRLSTTSIYACTDSSIDEFPPPPPEDIGARCCHTVTPLRNGQNMLVGGRASPAAPMKDCWLQTDSGWERVQDLPEPRFRHRSAAVVLPDNHMGLVVYGGKTSATKVATDVLLWDKQNGWQVLRPLKSDPMPRFGASFIRLGFNHGLLLGGMRHDGVICQGLWKWRLIIRDNVVQGISFRVSTAFDASAGMWPWLSRLGASYSVIRDEVLLIGGVAKQGCIPKDYEILSIVGSFSAFNEFEKEMELRVACVSPTTDPNVPRPFLVGHSTHFTTRQTTLIVGGGATCFSFGAYWNAGCWLLYDREAGLSSHWAIVKPKLQKPQARPQQLLNGIPSPLSTIVQQVEISSEPDFMRVLGGGLPKLLMSLDFGPCTTLWTPTYLLSKVPVSKSVVVHSSPSRTMNFQRKDFAYTTLPFHLFLKQLNARSGAHMYLRSISAASPTQLPANFEVDWPELAADFRIPVPLSFVETHKHSSPLRISANVNMWLHYDVMANVLFQIRGVRKLILFPPQDLKHLSFPAGSTTSSIDILEPADHPDREDKIKSVPNTHPHIAVLRPGQALYIPPMWAHTGTPLPVASTQAVTALPPASNSASDTASFIPSQPPSTKTPVTDHSSAAPSQPASNTPLATQSDVDQSSPVNVSLNVFFRTLHPQKYAAGRDVYGNRDLAPYEDGRRDLDKIIRRFMTSASPTQAQGSNREDGSGNQTERADAGTQASKPDGPKTEHDEGLELMIPKEMTRAYLERLADELRERAEKL